MVWCSDFVLNLCRETWKTATAVERRNLCSIDCYCRAMYLHVARGILLGKTPKALQASKQEEYILEAMEWNLDDNRSFQLSETFCQRDDGFDVMLSGSLEKEEEVLELLFVSSSNIIGVCAGGEGMLCDRASTWRELALDTWSIVLSAFSSRLVARDNVRLVSLQLLHASLRAPPPSSRRSWPCRKAFARLKELWETMNPRARRDASELRSEIFWYIQASDVAASALSLLQLHKQGLSHPSLDTSILRKFRSSSEILSHLAHEEGRVSLSSEYCSRGDALDLLRSKAVWHASQKQVITRAVFQCNYKDVIACKKPIPLVAQKQTLFTDVERVTATLLLTRLLDTSETKRKAEEDTIRWKQAEDLKKFNANQRKLAKQRGLKLAAAKKAIQSAGQGVLSQQEKFRTHRLLATSPTWDISCLKVKRTFFELEKQDSEDDTVRFSLLADW